MALILGNYIDESEELRRSNARRTDSIENDPYYVPECRVPQAGGFWSAELKQRVIDELFALRRVVKSLKHDMAMSSNATIVANAVKWQEEVQSLKMQLVEKDAEIKELNYALDASRRREEHFKAESDDWQKVASRSQKDISPIPLARPKDLRTGQFTKTGVPEIHHSKTDFKVWADYRLYKMHPAAIAKNYGIKADTASKYIKRYEEWYADGKIPTRELIDGGVYRLEFRNGSPSGKIESLIDHTVKYYNPRKQGVS